jgi:4-amino-4-deoxy-L-arabinose transferase-like glycosyltransferase
VGETRIISQSGPVSGLWGRLSGWSPGPWWIALAAAILMGVEAGARVFATNDEARFPVLAQDFLARGDWLRPRLNGTAYFNKPPLLAWLIALLSWPLGEVTQWTAVLPSVAAGVATVLLVYAIARDLFGAEAGRFAALAAMTSQGLFFHAHLAMPDVLMTCFITASLWMLVKMMQERAGPWWLGFYGLVGLAFWAKGPAGLLPLAVGLVFGIATRTGRRWSLHLAAGPALVVGLVGLWGLLGALSDHQALTHAVVTNQLGWYEPKAPRLALLTEPLRNTVTVLFPWVLLAPFVIPAAVRARGQGEPRGALLLPIVWLGVTVVLVALSHQQRLRYYIPTVPPMAVLLGWWLAHLAAKPESTRAAAVGIRRAVLLCWVVAMLVFVVGFHWELSRHNAAGDYARRALRGHPLLGEAPAVVAWGIPELPLAFYVRRPVLRVESERQLGAVLQRWPRAIVVTTEANWARRDERERSPALTPDAITSQRVVLVRPGAGR